MSQSDPPREWEADRRENERAARSETTGKLPSRPLVGPGRQGPGRIRSQRVPTTTRGAVDGGWLKPRTPAVIGESNTFGDGRSSAADRSTDEAHPPTGAALTTGH